MARLVPWRSIAAAALTWLIVVTTPAPAWAASADRQDAAGVARQMAAYLAGHPGGTAISDNEISYGGGALIVTLRPSEEHILGVPDCPSGWYCFYEWPYFGYPRGRLSSCGWQSLYTFKWQRRVESAHYNLNSGYASFYYNDARLFDVGTGNRVRSDAYPYDNLANYVYRYCP